MVVLHTEREREGGERGEEEGGGGGGGRAQSPCISKVSVQQTIQQYL